MTGYDGSEEKFTLLVECDQRSLEPSKDLSEEPSSAPSSSLSVSPSEFCTQELRYSDTVPYSTVNCPTVGATYCGWNTGSVWLYSISYVDARVTVSLCGGGITLVPDPYR